MTEWCKPKEENRAMLLSLTSVLTDVELAQQIQLACEEGIPLEVLTDMIHTIREAGPQQEEVV